MSKHAWFLWIQINLSGKLSWNEYIKLRQIIAKDIKEESTGHYIYPNPNTIINVPNQFCGEALFGECPNIKSFCRKHKIAYEHYTEPSGGYDGSVSWWKPGIKKEIKLGATADGDAFISVSFIRPYIEMLIQLVKDGLKCLPLLMNNPDIGKVVAKMLESKNPYKILEKELNTLIPQMESVTPALTVTPN